MTFEEQVAEILRGHCDTYRAKQSCPRCAAIAAALAPRVVAAIEASYQSGWDAMLGYDNDDKGVLAALRGLE